MRDGEGQSMGPLRKPLLSLRDLKNYNKGDWAERKRQIQETMAKSVSIGNCLMW